MFGVEDTFQRHVFAHHRRRHRLGDFVAHGEGIAENTGCVFDGGLGFDSTEGGDLGDLVVTVFLGDIPNDIPATTFVEVDVDIRHRYTFRVEQAFENQ